MKHPRNLLCVVQYEANTGFAWNYIEGLYAGLADLLGGHSVTTYVSYAAIPSPPRPLAGSAARAIALDVRLNSWRSIRSTLGAIRQLDIDTVYFTDFGSWHWALPLLRAAGVRWIVAHDHTSGHRDPPTGLKWILKWIRARIPGTSADRILTVSEFVARRQRNVALAPAHRVFSILNGLSLPDLDAPHTSHPLPGLDPERPIVTCVCRAAPEKGVDVLFRAFDRLLRDWPSGQPRPVLAYVGDGPAMPALTALRNTLSCAADIQMVGYRHDVGAFLRAASVCVVPSLWEDACPLGVLEPMAWGKPVIASAVGGVPEEINSPHVGVLVPKGDEQALADAITALLHDEARRVSIGRAARARIAHELSREHHLAAIAAHLQRADTQHPVALNSR